MVEEFLERGEQVALIPLKFGLTITLFLLVAVWVLRRPSSSEPSTPSP